ncbi:MFS transporter [Brucella sp. NM4]|uniref:MFS transporter n=1 Tax=Brucella sp. NM4 TaxID=3045175 RepID=UPI0024BC9EA1|nr:MFS transporter [Brucella sp. NM4]WHS33874.1 MFS transporter [Brucella sp. NM4]
MTGGSIIWGTIASSFTYATALVVAAIALVISLVLARIWQLPRFNHRPCSLQTIGQNLLLLLVLKVIAVRF